jgi:hypothetical protein
LRHVALIGIAAISRRQTLDAVDDAGFIDQRFAQVLQSTHGEEAAIQRAVLGRRFGMKSAVARAEGKQPIGNAPSRNRRLHLARQGGPGASQARQVHKVQVMAIAE